MDCVSFEVFCFLLFGFSLIVYILATQKARLDGKYSRKMVETLPLIYRSLEINKLGEKKFFSSNYKGFPGQDGPIGPKGDAGLPGIPVSKIFSKS